MRAIIPGMRTPILLLVLFSGGACSPFIETIFANNPKRHVQAQREAEAAEAQKRWIAGQAELDRQQAERDAAESAARQKAAEDRAEERRKSDEEIMERSRANALAFQKAEAERKEAAKAEAERKEQERLAEIRRQAITSGLCKSSTPVDKCDALIYVDNLLNRACDRMASIEENERAVAEEHRQSRRFKVTNLRALQDLKETTISDEDRLADLQGAIKAERGKPVSAKECKARGYALK